MHSFNRRQFLITTAAFGAATHRNTAAASPMPAGPKPASRRPSLCLFSKPLPFLGYRELARALEELGIPGVDLTTRPKGHVLPERVTEDLPKAHRALKDRGIEISMITTALTSPGDPAARPILRTAGSLGIGYFKLGYYRYREPIRLDATIDQVKRDVEGLAVIAQQANIQGGFHNHSGAYVGSAMWDHWRALRDTDPARMGFYFDPAHATIEGGAAGWKLGFHRLVSRLKMVATKDFYWEKQQGKWVRHMCPLGQGMVDYPQFFKLLAASNFQGPISLHVEYEIEGPTESARREKVLAAIERDYKQLRRFFDEAYG